MKPSLCLLSMLLTAWLVSAAEPVVVVQPPNPPLPEDCCQEVFRLSVKPSGGGFVLATFWEFDGVEVIGKDPAHTRKVVRLVFCPTKVYSEDISFRSDDPQRKHFVVSGFGQEIEVTGLEIPTSSGSSASGGVGGATSVAAVVKRLVFSDPKKEKATRVFEYSLRAIDADEARNIARSSAITLPTDSGSCWSSTLPPVREPETKQAVKPNRP